MNRLLLACLCFSLGFSQSVPANSNQPAEQTLAQTATTTLADLLEADQLRVRSWIDPAEGVVVGEEIRLTIEVSTQRWFAGGTSIHHPDEQNLVVLRRDAFATNLSRREGAVTWVVQRWNLELYPQAAGHYRLPPIELELAVNDAVAGVVRGTLNTEAITFSVALPAALGGLTSWLATPELTLVQELDRTPSGLVPGDAFTRQVTLRASHVTAMMLPPLESADIPGLPAYADSAQLRDTSNRGEATAERRESITYVVEKAGQYVLPEQVFYWWDTHTRELKSAVLEELRIDAGIAGAASPGGEPTPAPASIHNLLPAAWRQIVLILLAVSALGLVLWWWLRRSALPTEASLLRAVRRAVRRGDNTRAARLLYRWLNLFQPQPNWYQLRVALAGQADTANAQAAEILLKEAYGEAAEQRPVSLKRIKSTRRGWLARAYAKVCLNPVELKLNPDSSAAP